MAKRNYFRTQTAARTVWKKRLIAGAFAVAGLAFLWSSIMGEMGVVKYFRMSAHARELKREITRLTADNARLMNDVAALRNDPSYIERLARDKIGLSRPGEVVYYYGDTAE